MSLFKKSKIAKVTAGFVGFAAAIFMLGGTAVAPASAQTVEDLTAQIQSLLATISALQAQLASMQGGGSTSTTTACTFTRDLTLDVSGSDVTCLQDYLTGTGHFTFSGGSTGYFGPVTRTAVAAWQAANGVSPAVGYFGPISMAKYKEVAGTTVVTPPTTGGGGTTTNPPASVGTGLVVSSPLQPTASLAPESAAKLPFTKVTFTAGADGDVTVDSLVVERTGLAADASFSGIVLLDEDGKQLGVKKTLNSIHQATLTEDFVVPAGQSRTMTIAGNMAADNDARSGQVAGLNLVAVNTSATVSGSLPVTGAEHTINSTLAIGSVTLQRGSVDPGASQTKEVGTKDYTFSAVRITAGSAEKMFLKSIRWHQTGSAGRDDLENVKTYVDGTAYDVSVSSDGKYYTSVFGNGLLIDKGFSKEVSIKGDIIGGSNRTIDFDIAKRTDITLVGELFGYGITPPQTGTSNPTDDTSAFSSVEDPWYDASQVTVSTGSLTISSDTAVAAQNIAVNVPDQPLGGYIVEVKGEAISVASMVFNVMATGNEVVDITNVTMVDQNGSVIAGPVDGVDVTDPSGTLTFTDTVTFPVGTTKVVLKGKLGTDFVSNDTIQASTTPDSDWTTVTGQVTGNTITPAPGSAVSSLTMTVKAGALAISQASQPVAQSVIAGAQGFEFARYIFDASQSGEDIRVTTHKADLITAAGGATDLTNCQLYEGSTSLTTGSNSVNPTAVGDQTFTFDGTGLLIPKGTSKTISLACNLSTDASGAYTWGLTDNSSTYTSATGMTSGQTIAETMTADQTGIVMTAATSGSYTVTKDTSSAYNYRAVVAGTADVPLAAFKFTAGITEDINLKQVALQLANTASSAPKDLVGEKVTLWHDGVKVGEAQFGTSNADNATSTLTTSVKVVKGETEVIIVKGTLANHDANTNTTSTADNGGYGAFLGVTYDGDNVGLNGNYATGGDSGATISSGTTSDVTTNGVRIFRNVPSIALTSESSTIAAGSDLLKFRVTNPGSRDLILKKMVFGVATTGGNFTAFTLKGDGVAANSSAAEAAGATGSQTVTITFDATTNAKIVPANSYKDYALSNTGITDGSQVAETIAITLKADSAFAPAGNFLMETVSALSSYNIIWSPFSTTSPAADSSSESNLDWTNGYGLPGFPAPGSDMSTQVFTRPA